MVHEASFSLASEMARPMLLAEHVGMITLLVATEAADVVIDVVSVWWFYIREDEEGTMWSGFYLGL